MFTFVNGKITPNKEAVISVDDLAFHRGYGVTDFFLALDGVPLYIEQHLNRLFKSMSDFYLEIPYSRQQLTEIILDLIRRSDSDSLSIKVIVTGGNSPDHYNLGPVANLVIITRPFKYVNNSVGLKLMMCNYERELYQTKTVNYGFSIQQIPLLKRKGFDDLLYYKDGFISESGRSNVFIVKDGALYTSSIGSLKGITRENTIQEARALGIKTIIKPISVNEVIFADEVFLSSTTRTVHPVVQIDENQYPIGKISLQLQDALAQRAQKYIDAHKMEVKVM